jgi:hypothetical protein
MNNAPAPMKSTFFSAFRGVLSVAFGRFAGGSRPMALPILSGPARGLWFRQNAMLGDTSMQTNVNDTLKALSLICQKGWTIWDCGTSEGVSTVLFSKFVGIDGLVVCFEPKRDAFLQTYDNATLNGCNNILFHFATVGQPAPKHAFLPPVCARQLSLDEAYEDGEIPIPHLVRLDLEKTGTSVLTHGSRLIREQRPLIVINRYEKKDRQTIIDFSQRNGYSLQSLEDGKSWNEAAELEGPVLCSPVAQAKS